MDKLLVNPKFNVLNVILQDSSVPAFVSVSK